uniref:Breast cancer anti-estrogen resistance protein 3-like n=1 Tax=Electrophorus electricus TaxID=8005 RepID=A0A4W4G1Z0_ELEEL
MNNRSIAWWLRQIGLSQYTKTLEREYYGLEDLMLVTDSELQEMGVEDQNHRMIILTQLQRYQKRLTPHTALSSGASIAKEIVSQKYSLGSSLDLAKPTDLFRQSIIPRLRRRDSNRLFSCSQLEPFNEPDHSSTFKRNQSKRRSVGVFFSQVFSGRREMDSLKKELEEELKLSTEDIRSHAWYHGQLQREGAEQLLHKDSDFLVRDQRSGGGDYVLSCMWKKQHMHFKIIRVVLRPKEGYSRELFQFENDQFDNIPALIRFHVGGRRPISQTSGATILHPVTRTLPLRVISERQAAMSSSRCSAGASTWSGDKNKRRSLSSTHMDKLQVHNSLLRCGSQPANLESVGIPSLQSAQSDSNLRPPQESSSAPISPVFRTGSDPLLSPSSARSPGPSQSATGGATLRGSDGQLNSRAPPKPLRLSTLFPGMTPVIPRIEVDPASHYDELVPQIPPAMLPKGHTARLRVQETWCSRARLTDTSFTFLEAQRAEEEQEGEEEEGGPGEGPDWRFQRPQTETSSCFRLDTFRSLLLPDGNRPLEQGILHALKELFARTDPATTALHMLSVDCQVARVTGVTDEQKRIMGVDSGLELITLPHGSQLRQDLLERHHLIALGIAVDILGCSGPVIQRAAVLHKVIQLAQALHSAAHDLYAFSAVMKALELPQVSRLEMTWRVLRRNHTESAVTFEKILKPFLKALNEGDNSVLSGPVSLPHIVPLLRLMEGEDVVENTENGCYLLYNILQSARTATMHTKEYEQHAHTLLSAGWEPVPELLEAFRTEFALRLFWGQAGAEAGKKERYEKFDRVLTVLSNKLEPNVTSEL